MGLIAPFSRSFGQLNPLLTSNRDSLWTEIKENSFDLTLISSINITQLRMITEAISSPFFYIQIKKINFRILV